MLQRSRYAVGVPDRNEGVRSASRAARRADARRASHSARITAPLYRSRALAPAATAAVSAPPQLLRSSSGLRGSTERRCPSPYTWQHGEHPTTQRASAGLRTLFAALKQERFIFGNPMVGILLTTPVRVPTPLPSDRLRGLLDDLDGPRARLLVALVDIHGLRPGEVSRLRLDDLDLMRLTVRVSRGDRVHTIYLDAITAELATAWLTERHLRWPNTPNPHLFITSQTAHHPAQPPLSYCGLPADFDQIGILPRQLWSDRDLHEARTIPTPSTSSACSASTHPPR